MDKNISTFINKYRRYWKVALIVAVGILLIIISSLPKESGEEVGNEITLDEYRVALEERVAAMCSSVAGVGKCKVFITFERGEQSSYKGSTLLEVKPPKVLGVTVVCRGADYDYVRKDLTEMLSALFDIGSNRIAILKLNS